MAKSYARLETLNAALSSDFGLDWATKLFGEEAIASLPVFKAGKNKGKPKGYVIWRKAISSGWCQEYSTPAAEGQMVRAWIGEGFSSLQAVRGLWLGRVQELAGPMGSMFQEARDRHAREVAWNEAQWEAEKKDMLARNCLNGSVSGENVHD